MINKIEIEKLNEYAGRGQLITTAGVDNFTMPDPTECSPIGMTTNRNLAFPSRE
jgi:hypothetical protein